MFNIFHQLEVREFGKHFGHWGLTVGILLQRGSRHHQPSRSPSGFDPAESCQRAAPTVWGSAGYKGYEMPKISR